MQATNRLSEIKARVKALYSGDGSGDGPFVTNAYHDVPWLIKQLEKANAECERLRNYIQTSGCEECGPHILSTDLREK